VASSKNNRVGCLSKTRARHTCTLLNHEMIQNACLHSRAAFHHSSSLDQTLPQSNAGLWCLQGQRCILQHATANQLSHITRHASD
jgi:hypothetical protein